MSDKALRELIAKWNEDRYAMMSYGYAADAIEAALAAEPIAKGEPTREVPICDICHLRHLPGYGMCASPVQPLAKPAFDARAWLEARFPNFCKDHPNEVAQATCIADSAHFDGELSTTKLLATKICDAAGRKAGSGE